MGTRDSDLGGRPVDERRLDRDFAAFRDEGSAEALGRVFDALAPRLLLVAAHLTRDAAQAEDLVQTAFLEAIRDAERYDGSRPVSAWLAGILRHRALDLRRRNALRRAAPIEALDEHGSHAPDPAEIAADAELYDAVVAAVGALEEPYRAVVSLRVVHGLAPTEIAHTLDRAPGTVRMQLKRGLERLRSAMPERAAWAALAFGDGARGLEPVREAVLAGASASAAATTTTAAGMVHAAAGAGATLGGLVAMKAIAMACAAALALFVWWMADREPASAPAAAVAAAAPELDEVRLARPMDAAQTDAAGTERVALAAASPAATESAPASAAVATLELRVRFASDGTPAADVGVYLARVDDEGAPVALGLERRTDARGVAAFDGAELSAGPYDAHVDRAPSTARVAWPEQRTADVLIPSGQTLEGRVVDLAGEGVAGARVLRLNPGHHDKLQALATSDADGRFTVRDLADGAELLARASGYQPSPLERVRGDDFVLQLGARGHRVAGRVRLPGGAPAPFALIALGVDEDAREEVSGSSRDPRGRGKAMDLEGLLLRADADGRFESDEVPASHLLVIARPAVGTADPGLVAWTTRFLRGPLGDELELVLAPGATIAGVVTEGQGLPVEGALLEAEWEGEPALGQMEDDLGPWASDRAAVSDASGAYRLDGLLPGAYDLRVRAGMREVAEDERVVAAGSHGEWNPVATQLTSLEVRVLGPDGAPLAGYGVTLDDVGAGSDADPLVARRTDAAGRVRHRGVLARPELRLGVFPPTERGRLAGLPMAVRAIDGTAASVEIRVEPVEWHAERLSGRYVDARGAPLGAQRLWLERDGWEQPAATTTGADGSFVFDAPPASELRIAADGRVGRGRLLVAEATLAPRQALDLGDVVEPDVAPLVVRVRRADGVEVRAHVQLEQSGAPAPMRWRVRGDVHHADVRPGEYLVRAVANGCAPVLRRVLVAAEGAELDLVVEPAPPAVVTLRLPASAEPAGIVHVRVSIVDADGTIVRRDDVFAAVSFGDASPTAPLAVHLAPGSYTVRATLEGKQVAAPLTVGPDGGEPLELDLR